MRFKIGNKVRILSKNAGIPFQAALNEGRINKYTVYEITNITTTIVGARYYFDYSEVFYIFLDTDLKKVGIEIL